ncbi:MAG TPA: DUF6065 family protein [Allosphingosinicella sp.]|nr:DUF6065 family protein [Allosphingosinicella sp.]
MNGDSMDLICYKYDGWQPRIRPGNPKRGWMDETNERYAYRCLPLSIANSHGWELLSSVAFEARWDGGTNMEAVEIRMDPGYSDHLKPVTLFGYGTLTWHVEAIFRTPPGWNLYLSGPPNRQKDGIQALGGIIETDWSPYTFTMNWRFTRPGQWIRFEENEPIAFFFPVERGRAEQFKPRIERLEDAPELRAAFEKWSESRNAFQKWVIEAKPSTPAEKWQKLYFRGLDADGKRGPSDHQSKLRLPPFYFPDGSFLDPPEAKACPMRSKPEPVRGPDPSPFEAKPQGIQNVLLNPAGNVTGGSNPALTLALGRLGFGAQPQQQPAPAQVQAPARSDPATELALKRRDWIMDVHARQRLLSPRAGLERARDLSGEDFLDYFYSPAWPVVIEGALEGWRALEHWTPDYLAAKIGSAPVDVQAGREANGAFEIEKDRHRRQMPFDQFISLIEGEPFGNDLYITAYNAAANRAALAPLDADLGTLEEYLTPEPGMMWIGPAGTFTPLHFDLTNNLIVQVVGTKKVIMSPPSQTQRLYNYRHVFSAVHDITDEGQLARYPLARGAQTIEIDLHAGEILFVPIGWWHQVTALDFSVTLTHTNFLWPNEGHESFPRG